MFRASAIDQSLVAPKVSSTNPADWQATDNVAEGFHVFVSHLYKGYFYYTGSSYPAHKPTEAVVVYTDEVLKVHIWASDPAIDRTEAYLKENEPDFFSADFLALNLLTPGGTRLTLGVNPIGQTYAERNLEKDIELDFAATVQVGADRWSATFEVPLSLLELTGAEGEAIGFDIVRQEQAWAMISTWARGETTPPYNKIYDYPVFHYAPLYLGQRSDQCPALDDALEGVRAEIESSGDVEVSTFTEISLTVTLGKHGLVPGGSLRVRHASEVIDTGVNWWLEEDWSEIQAENPRSIGAVTVEADGPFEVDCRRTFAYITYTGDQSLPEGSRIHITLGDRDQGGPGVQVQRVAMPDHPIEVDLDPLARGIAEPVRPWPKIDIVPGEAVALLVTVPGAVPAGSPFEICVRAVDHEGNLKTDYTGKVELTCDAAESSLPRTVEIGPDDNGCALVEATIDGRGLYMVSATDGVLAAVSNYICTDGRFGEGYIVYGDPHTHSGTSDGYYTPEKKYVESRCLRGLQFWSLSDHDFDQTPAKWKQYQELAARCDKPGKFACILGYEWTPSGGHGKAFERVSDDMGHYVVLLPETSGRSYRSDEWVSITPAKLLEATAKEPGHIVIPHYHGGRSAVGQNSYAIEVAAWGGKVSDKQSDVSRGLGVLDTIAEGHRLGVIAGTDHGSEGLLAFRPAEMTVARVDELTRRGVMDAIRRRSVYATSWFRALLWLDVNGTAMGGETTIKKDQVRTLTVRLAARPSFINLEVRRGTETIERVGNYGGRRFTGEWMIVDETPLEQSTFYTVKVTFPEGNAVWSSPVWVDLEE